MSEPRTADQWLALGDKLAVELAKVLTPEPWDHDVMDNPSGANICAKCELKCFSGNRHINPCPIPDPVKIDWNTAKEWFRKADRSRAWDETWCMFKLSTYGTKVSFAWWLQFICKAKHYLIAAAMAVERNKE